VNYTSRIAGTVLALLNLVFISLHKIVGKI
jgi:hypothetical protein